MTDIAKDDVNGDHHRELANLESEFDLEDFDEDFDEDFEEADYDDLDHGDDFEFMS